MGCLKLHIIEEEFLQKSSSSIPLRHSIAFDKNDSKHCISDDIGCGECYRYSFNGKETDDEVSGSGNQYDYGFRIYNPRIAKFLSVDPLTSSFPWYTPYQFAGNKPIMCSDLDGLEERIETWEEDENGQRTLLSCDNWTDIAFDEVVGPLGAVIERHIYTADGGYKYEVVPSVGNTWMNSLLDEDFTNLKKKLSEEVEIKSFTIDKIIQQLDVPDEFKTPNPQLVEYNNGVLIEDHSGSDEYKYMYNALYNSLELANERNSKTGSALRFTFGMSWEAFSNSTFYKKKIIGGVTGLSSNKYVSFLLGGAAKAVTATVSFCIDPTTLGDATLETYNNSENRKKSNKALKDFIENKDQKK
jgi:RHS repeat-associated protein